MLKTRYEYSIPRNLDERYRLVGAGKSQLSASELSLVTAAMDAVIVYFTATFVLCLFLVIFRLLRLSALKRERQRSLEDARHPTSGVIVTSWSGG